MTRGRLGEGRGRDTRSIGGGKRRSYGDDQGEGRRENPREVVTAFKKKKRGFRV